MTFAAVTFAFDHFGGHFGEPIVEDRCLGTTPFEADFLLFLLRGSLWGASCREQMLRNHYFFCFWISGFPNFLIDGVLLGSQLSRTGA